MQANAPTVEPPSLHLSDLLLVNAREEDAELWLQHLKESGWQGKATLLTNPADIHPSCQRHIYHAILLDQAHPLLTSHLTSELLRRLGGHPPVILVTDAPGETGALEGLAHGAFDYVFRSCLSRLPIATQRAVETTDLRLNLAGTDDQLAEAEQRFQALAELNPAGMAIESADGIMYANQALADLLNAPTPLDILGKSLLSWVSNEARDSLLQQLGHPISPQAPLVQDLTLSTIDGVPLEARLYATEIGYHGQPSRLYLLEDRREQRRVATAISNLATFAQENPNPILMFGSDGRLTYYNDAALEMAKSFGRDHPAACLPPQVPALVESSLLSGQNRLRINWTQSGRTFLWSFFPHRSSGVVHAFVVETTEQVNLEDQLRHSQRLEGIGRLAGGVAHEFSNLITVIQGQAQLLAELEGLSPKGREAMQQLLHSTERAADLTRQLQAFSRRNHVVSAPLQLNEILREFGDLLQRTLGDHIRIAIETTDSLPFVSGDRNLLEQVLLNLAVNARDAMPEGGDLSLRTSVVDYPSEGCRSHPEARPGRYVRLAIADTGAGIDSRLLPYLFDPFFTTKKRESANGLGLSTVYGIVKQHKGWIEVQSQLEQGSTFQVYLPVLEQAVEERASSKAKPSRGEGGLLSTVLIVEDEPAVRWTLKSMLEHEGYRILEASNPLEALAVWRDHRQEINVLLTDLVMPSGISGQEMAKHFQEVKPELRVIYTSGYCIDSVARGLPLEAGVNFLQKPFSARDFSFALNQQAEAQRDRRPDPFDADPGITE